MKINNHSILCLQMSGLVHFQLKTTQSPLMVQLSRMSKGTERATTPL
ncbi:hypothetical protein LINPERHAP1_LOCUS12748 [Linum perenne]